MSAPESKIVADQALPELAELRTLLRGSVTLPSDASYEHAKESWNHEYLKFKPKAIITCCSTWDVSTAVKYLRKHKLDFTVACGRHSLHSIKDDIIMLDLSGMRGIFIDPRTQTGIIEGGCRNRDVARECSLYNLHMTSGTNGDTGIGGLTLGGGAGYMCREFGMACDHVLGVEMVTATGEVIRANATENPDLYYAVRGAGFNFGIVTKFFVQLHPIGHIAKSPNDPNTDKVIGGIRIYPYSSVPNIWKTLRQTCDPFTLHRSLTNVYALAHGPDGNPITVVQPSWIGRDIDEGFKLINEKVKFDNTLVDAVRPMTYLELQDCMDPLTPAGHWIERGGMLLDITDEFIDVMTKEYLKCPDGAKRSAVLLMSFGGKVAEIPAASTAFSRRNARYWCLILALFEPQVRDAAVKWVDGMYAVLKKFSVGRYANTLENGLDAASIYPDGQLERLRAIKTKWDPENVFHHNHNIAPAPAKK